MKVTILSGVPGSGKSTYVKTHIEGGSIHSADHFFTTESGYQFEASKLGAAHAQCLRGFITACQSRYPTVVVDNTNTTTEEIAPYYSIAKAYGYEVELVTLLVDTPTALARGTHGVPEKNIDAMQRRIRDRRLPRFWDLTQTTLAWDETAQCWAPC